MNAHTIATVFLALIVTGFIVALVRPPQDARQ
jgi:hypothetical protein